MTTINTYPIPDVALDDRLGWVGTSGSGKTYNAALGISRQMLHKILAEKAPITPEMAVRIGKFCGNGPDLWLGMQVQHDLAKAQVALADEVRRIPTTRAA
jgi:addiction module HigA family antidote